MPPALRNGIFPLLYLKGRSIRAPKTTATTVVALNAAAGGTRVPSGACGTSTSAFCTGRARAGVEAGGGRVAGSRAPPINGAKVRTSSGIGRRSSPAPVTHTSRNERPYKCRGSEAKIMPCRTTERAACDAAAASSTRQAIAFISTTR